MRLYLLLGVLVSTLISVLAYDPRQGPARRLGTRMIVMAHMREDLGWIHQLSDVAPVTIMSYTLHDHRVTPTIRIVHEPDRPGKEVAAYLRFILDHYNQLPDQMAFVHAHHTSWHTWNQDILLRVADWNVEGYRPITSVQFRWSLTSEPGPNRGRHHDLDGVWGMLFEPHLGPIWQDEVVYYCCGSFMVSKSMVRRHPRHVYQKWYDWVTASQDPNVESAGYIFEYTWHRIFGMRHDDPDRLVDQ